MNFRNHLDEFNLNTQNVTREQGRYAGYDVSPIRKRSAINVWTVFLMLIQRLNAF